MPAPASLPPPGSPDVLYVVDLSGYVFRAYHAITPLSNTKGEVTHATMGTVNMIQKVVNEKRPAMLAVAMDSPKPSFRKAIDDRYKATRPPAPDDLRHQMKRCREIALAYNIPVYEQDGIEADDLIACLCDRATKEQVKVVIVTADKDMMQLIHDDDQDIVMWDSMRDRVYGPKEVEEKFGVAPSKVREVLAFMGDTSDNIPGVPGVGPKTAADLVRKFGSVEGVYAHAAELGKGKTNESIRTHEADARKSLELVTLKCDLDVAFDKQHLKYGGANDAKLIELFTELEFTRLLGIVKAGAGASAEGAKGPGPEGAPASTDPYLRMIAASKSNAPPSPAAAPALEPPAERGKVVYETVLSVEPIAKMVAEAKKQGEIAIALAVTSEEAMRADVIGVGLASTPGHGIYVPLSHRYLGAPKMLSWAALQEVLVPVLRDASVMKIGHDVKRTIITLEEKGVAVAGSAFDPMVASYLFDPEGDHTLAAIAKRELDADAPKYEGDAKKNRDRAVPFDELEVERATTFIAPAAETALASARRMGPRLERDGLGPLMRDIEMPLLSVLCEMERVGVLVDTAQLLRASKEAEETLAALDAKAKKIVGRDFAIRSRDQLEEILFDELKLPVLKRTPKGGRSTDASVLEELANEHELPAVILDYREMDKLRGTYLEALPRAQNPKTGRIHTRFDQAVAATGRLSSNDPNLQNIPVRSELGKSIRKAFIAAPGARLVSADYSQIELRVLAHLSNDPRLMEAFTADIDVHTHTASVIFEVKPEDVTKEMRGRAKTINFGVIYGMGEPRLARSLGITRKEAGQFIAQYFRRYEGVNRFMNDTVENAKRGEAVRTLTGRRRFLPNLHSANRGLRFEAERIARNTPIQGTAADIIKLAMVAIGRDRPSPNAKMILTVHDELVFEVPENEIADAKRKIVLGMENAMKLRVPLKVDISDGATWADAKA